jgi:hypothetical protein
MSASRRAWLRRPHARTTPARAGAPDHLPNQGTHKVCGSFPPCARLHQWTRPLGPRSTAPGAAPSKAQPDSQPGWTGVRLAPEPLHELGIPNPKHTGGGAGPPHQPHTAGKRPVEHVVGARLLLARSNNRAEIVLAGPPPTALISAVHRIWRPAAVAGSVCDQEVNCSAALRSLL